jgi:hypothetical protein
VKKLLLAVLLIPALGYAGYLTTMAIPAAERSTEFSARINRLGTLAEAGAQRLHASGSTQTLREACRTVEPVDRLQLLAYFGAPADDALTPLGQQAKYFPARQIFALKPPGEARWDTEETVKHSALPWRPRSAFAFFEDLLTSPPGEWGWRKQRWNEPFNHPLAEVRYLVVHQLKSLQVPSLTSATTYQAGSMSFRSALLNASTGEQLCEGATVLAQDGKVEVRGRGHTDAEAQKDLEGSKDRALLGTFIFKTHEFALGTVCSLGGTALCKATGYPYEGWK